MSNDRNSARFHEVSPAELRQLVTGEGEIAVLDLRSAAAHSLDGHPLLVASLPLARLELEVAHLVPRLSTKIVVFDGGDGVLVRRGATRLAELGYDDVSILAGGAKAWADAGFEVFTGTNVLSIAFGEFAEVTYGTPHISAGDLKRKLDNKENVIVLDSRTIPEFSNFSIPGAVSLPGAEIVYRFHQTVDDPDALVVVNCAGRTRSIIGAQALINADVPNKVVSLANGTMDWLMDGSSLQQGAYNFPGRPVGQTLEQAKAAGERLRARFPIKFISRDQLRAFQADAHRSTYLFDVRTEEEFLAGHVAGSRWAEGGQLVQGVQRWVGTQNGRIVLTDSEDFVRSSITASWLLQINWGEVYVLADALKGPLETGPEPRRLAAPTPLVDAIDVEELARALDSRSSIVVDVDLSTAYRIGHIPGAHFATRERLADDADRLPGAGTIVLTSSDGHLAAFAAAELQARTGRPVRLLAGGTSAWIAAGRTLREGEESLLHPTDDVALSAYQRPENERFPAFRQYLAWELGLVEQLERDGTHRYQIFPAQLSKAAAA